MKELLAFKTEYRDLDEEYVFLQYLHKSYWFFIYKAIELLFLFILTAPLYLTTRGLHIIIEDKTQRERKHCLKTAIAR